MSGWIKAGQAGWGAITGVKSGTKFKGQSTIEAIKKKGKEFKSKMAGEAKKAGPHKDEGVVYKDINIKSTPKAKGGRVGLAHGSKRPKGGWTA